MREIGIFFGNVRKNINTNVETLGDFIALLKDQDVFDGDLSSNTILEKYSFMKPNTDGSEIELDFQSLSSSLPQEDFKIFISSKKTKFGLIEEDLEHIVERINYLEDEVSAIKEILVEVLYILKRDRENFGNSFESRVPSNNFAKESKISNSLEEAYKRMQRS